MLLYISFQMKEVLYSYISLSLKHGSQTKVSQEWITKILKLEFCFMKPWQKYIKRKQYIRKMSSDDAIYECRKQQRMWQKDEIRSERQNRLSFTLKGESKTNLWEKQKKTYRQPKDENKQGRESKRSKNKESESLRIWTKFDSNKKDKPSYTIVHT